MNISLLQRYIHGAFEDRGHWCIQHFIRDINMKHTSVFICSMKTAL